MPDDIILKLLAFVIFIYSVVLHEVSHGFAARAMGDHTAERMGRLTLNPIRHLDMVGSFLLPLFLYIIHSPFLFGYAKPVPYNHANLNDRRWGPAKVAIAGPATNIALAALMGVVIRAVGPALGDIGTQLISYAVSINLVLALFNLMPVPPLDGHWLLMAALPASAYSLKLSLYRMQWVLLIIVIFFIFPTLFPLVGLAFKFLTGLPMM